MNDPRVFRATPRTIGRAVVFVILVFLTVYMSVNGLRFVTGPALLLLRVAAVVPVLVFFTSVLYLLSVVSRKITLGETRLIHRQIFKNYDVTWTDIRRVECLKGIEGQVDTIKIFWSGVPFYLDARAIGDFEVFVQAFFLKVPQGLRADVTAFSAFES